MSRQLFVNLPVADLGKAVGFFTDLGFSFDAGLQDLDGHHWEVFWMDADAMEG